MKFTFHLDSAKDNPSIKTHQDIPPIKSHLSHTYLVLMGCSGSLSASISFPNLIAIQNQISLKCWTNR